MGVLKYHVIDKKWMSDVSTAELSNTAYDILKVLGKDADFLYDTIDSISRMQIMPASQSWWRCGKQSKKTDKNMFIC